MIQIIPVVVHTFVITAQVSKIRTCAQCGKDFIHHGEIRVVGMHRAFLGLFGSHAQEMSRLIAEDRWPRKLKKWNLPALCPHCGEFQPDMFDAIRVAGQFWLKVVGAILLFPSVVAAILSFALAFSDTRDHDGTVILICSTAIALSSPLAFVCRSVSNAYLNPNNLSRAQKEKVVKAQASKIEDWILPIGVRRKRSLHAEEMEY